MEQCDTKTNAFSLALAEATERLADIERRYATLATEREQLQAVVNSLTAFVPTPGAASGAPVSNIVLIAENTETPKQAEVVPVWKRTEEQFLAAGNASMSVPELARRLNEKGINVERKTIRVAMSRKPEIFVSTGEYGKFRLRTFPTDAQIQRATGGH